MHGLENFGVNSRVEEEKHNQLMILFLCARVLLNSCSNYPILLILRLSHIPVQPV